MRQVLVDLTPLLPGGENGGVKILTLRLISNMAKLAPHIQFTLMSLVVNSQELSVLTKQYPNIQVQLKSNLSSQPQILQKLLKFIYKKRFTLLQIMPRNRQKIVKQLYLKLYHSRIFKKKVQSDFNLPDLLFCPFTAPFLHDPRVPTISVIYDLQSYYYPFFFSQEEQIQRKENFNAACQLSDKLICISNFVRQTVLEHGNVNPNKVVTIPIKTACRLPTLPVLEISEQLLITYGLHKARFLFYPANFWEHKNHKMLLVAFASYRKKYPKSHLKLVCTGSNSPQKFYLQKTIKKMNLAEHVIFTDYLSNEAFAVLMHTCLAVIFPSLYEGFGMPVLEAMAAGKPVLCSNLTSLPEVAGEAALLFDPKNPSAITYAIERIDHDLELARQLIKAGQKQIKVFSDEEEMAREYLTIFEDTVRRN